MIVCMNIYYSGLLQKLELKLAGETCVFLFCLVAEKELGPAFEKNSIRISKLSAGAGMSPWTT